MKEGKLAKRVVLVDGRGNIRVDAVPIDRMYSNGILCSNHASLISSGTEISLIQGRKSYPSEQREFALGYSSAGIVKEVGARCKNVQVGDRVACGGWTRAVHADLISVPRHLFAKVPDTVKLEEAAFISLACVSLHGVRRSGLGLGERAVIIGQGVVGQLCAQFGRLVGAEIIVTDLLDFRLEISKQLGVDLAISGKKNNWVKEVMDFTNGVGADAVFICSGGDNTRVFNQATQIARGRAKIVLIGRSKIAFDDEIFYRKELTLLSSRSYGPGRYDPEYEEKGQDYPIGYIRWTENRNMQEVLRLLEKGLLKIKPLITHRFKIDEAPKAYQMIMKRSSKTLAVLLCY